MTKKNLLAVIISASILAGCGDDVKVTGDETGNLEQYLTELSSRNTSIDFTLLGSNAWVPPPSALLMDTNDGTLKLPTSGDDALSNPLAAMNTADGWSLSMPIALRFKGTGFTAGTSITSGITILKLSGKLTDSTPPSVTGAISSFVATTTSDSIVITFTQPLDPSSDYIFALTDGILDKNGDPIGTSQSYAGLKTSNTTYTEGSLASAQKVVKGVEQYMAGASIDTKSIIYSSWFSTQSLGSSLFATKSGYGSAIGQSNDLTKVWKGNAIESSVDSTNPFVLSFGTSVDFDEALIADTNFTKYAGTSSAQTSVAGLYSGSNNNTVNVTKGTVKLPHFLSKGTDWNTAPFEAAGPSLAKLINALSSSADATAISASLVSAGVDPSPLSTLATATSAEQFAFMQSLVGVNITLADGSRLDTERVPTRFTPFAKIRSMETVNFLLFTPTTIPANMPIVIYQHGITSAKENAYYFADKLARGGIGVIAIDLPLHGERSLDAVRSANASALAYINLSNIPVARDNLQQSTFDLLGLRASISIAYSVRSNSFAGTPLAGAANPLVSTSAPRIYGHSLGGIVGSSTAAFSNHQTGDTSTDTGLNSLFAITSSAIANSGGQIGNLLMGSASFGPLIKHNLGLNSNDEYKAYVSSQCNLTSTSTSKEQGACYTQMAADGTYDKLKTALEASFLQFTYAVQTVIDGIDPVNMTGLIDDKPFYLSQVEGDLTVPNTVSTAPLAGTKPIADQMSISPVNSSNTTPSDNTKVYVQFSSADHSTAIFPQDSGFADQNHHNEMIRQVTDFLSDNKLDSVSNSPSVLQ